MSVVLDEIDELINKFSGEQREEAVNFYIQLSREKLTNRNAIRKKEIELLRRITKYMLKQDRDELVDQIINTKIVQARTFILDNFKDDFSRDKEFFSKISKWMMGVIEDIRETFCLEEEKDLTLLQTFNSRLCEEMILIFCSCEKFNSSGNQLILDLLMYKNSLKDTISFDFDELIGRVRKNFNPGKALKMDEIQEIYDEIEK